MPPTDDHKTSSGLSATDRAYLQQQAVNDFSRTMNEIQNVYFSHLKELSSSGSMGAAGMQGMQNLSVANQSAIGMQGGVAGAALLATAFGTPLAGAMIAGAGSFAVNQYLGGQQVVATQAQQQGQAQMLAGQIGGMSGGNASGIYNQFMSGLDPTRYGVGVERLAAYDAMNQGAIGFGTGNFNRLLQMSINPMNPEGNISSVMRMGEGSRAIAGMSINSLGLSSESYLSQFRIKTSVPDQAWNEFYDRDGKGFPTDAAQSDTYAVGLKSELLKKGTREGKTEDEFRKSFYAKNRRTGSETPDEDGMMLDILIGGEGAAEAYRKRFSKTSGIEGMVSGVMGGAYRQMRFAESAAQEQDIFSGDLYQRGDVAGAIGERKASSGNIKAQLDILRERAFNANGTVKSPEAAMRYAQLSSAYTGSLSATSDMAMSASSPMISEMMGAGSVGFALGSFGNTGAITSGMESTIGAGNADIARIEKRLSSGNLTPDQQAGLQERLFAAITRNIEAFDRATTSVMQMGQVASQTGTATATGAFQRGLAGGASGSELRGLTNSVAAGIGDQIAGIDSQIAQREAMVRGMGGDPAMDMTLNRMKQQKEGFATQAFTLDREMAVLPLGVGTRRDMSRTDFNLDILGTMPGAVGAMRSELQGGIENTRRAYGEMEANRTERIGSGKWMEVDQEKFEQQAFDLKRKEAGYRSQLMEGFESRLVSTVINAPTNMDFVNPEMAYRVAVGAGLKGARFGGTADQSREYMRDAYALGSIAGNTSTSEGMYVTTMTGARHAEQEGGYPSRGGGSAGGSLAGVTLRVVIESAGEDGRTKFQNGTAHFTGTGNTVESSASGLAENSRRTTSKY